MTPSGEPLFRKKRLAVPHSALLLAAGFTVSVLYYWHGLGPPGDAERYVSAALRWYESGPHLGENHWALRHLFVLPMAASFALFGPSEFSATIPNIAYAGGLVAITYFFVRRNIGRAEALAAGAVVAMSAFFVARPMEIGVYGAEIFFAAAACWFFVESEFERRKIAFLIAAGLAAGVAWTIREQSLSLMAAFALLLLLKRRQILLSSFALATGFGLVLIVEWVIYFVAAGDAFYRYRIDLQHADVGWNTLDSDRDPAFAKFIRPFKDLASDPISTPLTAFAIGLGLLLPWRRMVRARRSRETIKTFAVVAAISAVISSYAFDLALPRYYPVFPYFVLLVIGVGAVALKRRYGARAIMALFLVLILLNVAAEDFSNYNEYTEPRYLAERVMEDELAVYTDPLTASRTRHLLRLGGMAPHIVSHRVRSLEEVPVGALFFKAHPTVVRERNWCIMSESTVRPTNWTHSLIRNTGADRLLGAKVARIVAKPEPVQMIRVLPPGPQIDPYKNQDCKAGA